MGTLLLFLGNFLGGVLLYPLAVPALTLGRVGRLPRASGLRGPPSSKKAQDVLATKFIC